MMEWCVWDFRVVCQNPLFLDSKDYTSTPAATCYVSRMDPITTALHPRKEADSHPLSSAKVMAEPA